LFSCFPNRCRTVNFTGQSINNFSLFQTSWSMRSSWLESSSSVKYSSDGYMVLAITVDGRRRPNSGIWEKAMLKRWKETAASQGKMIRLEFLLWSRIFAIDVTCNIPQQWMSWFDSCKMDRKSQCCDGSYN
jgi:hypothetical protein